MTLVQGACAYYSRNAQTIRYVDGGRSEQVSELGISTAARWIQPIGQVTGHGLQAQSRVMQAATPAAYLKQSSLSFSAKHQQSCVALRATRNRILNHCAAFLLNISGPWVGVMRVAPKMPMRDV